jgi:hypothetical protein
VRGRLTSSRTASVPARIYHRLIAIRLLKRGDGSTVDRGQTPARRVDIVDPSKSEDLKAGLMGGLVLNTVADLLLFVILTAIPTQSMSTTEKDAAWVALIGAGNVVAVVAALIKHRPFVAIGIVLCFTVPALIFAACMLAMGLVTR